MAKLSTFHADFATAPSWMPAPPGVISISSGGSGRMVMTATGGFTSWAQDRNPALPNDFLNDAITCQVWGVVSGGSSLGFGVVSAAAANIAQISKEPDGSFNLRRKANGGAFITQADTGYSFTAGDFWRLREINGWMEFHTSSDADGGANWTFRDSIYLDGMATGDLGIEFWIEGTNGTQFIVDSVNITPRQMSAASAFFL
jgi:hypothetical protein